MNEHKRRFKNLSEALAECRGRIKTIEQECDQNPCILKYETPETPEELDAELDKFDMTEEIVIEIIEKVMGDDPQRTKTSKKRKSPIENENSGYPIIKKLKLENLQGKVAPTTPAPIRSFLDKFKFKIKKQDTTNPPSPPPKKTDKEICMSKFSQLKSKFEKNANSEKNLQE